MSADLWSPDKLSDALIRKLAPPASGSRLKYDTERRGLAIRVTAAGAKAFVFNYRNRGGQERRKTIGPFPEWSVSAARDEADELRRQVNLGRDPLGELAADRDAPTVSALCDRFIEDHLDRKREITARDYRRNIEKEIRPALGRLKVASVTFADVDKLHRLITRRAPTQANRVLAVLSKMFAHAIKLRWRPDNPCKGVERNQENKRKRYLSGDELARLTAALAEHKDQESANIVRLLLLTGARSGEVFAAQWDQFDLQSGDWTKPGATTKTKTDHHVPLSGPARQLVAQLRAAAEKVANEKGRDVSPYLFPGRPLKAGKSKPHLTTIKRDWAKITKAANLSDLTIHDLRHSYASNLASAGFSLPVIGALLGHTQPATTHRYAHLFNDALRDATERVGAAVENAGKKPSGEIISFRGNNAPLRGSS